MRWLQAECGRQYLAANVFVLPSLEEGDPIVAYEAAAYALPVMASPVGAGRIGAETGSIFTFDTDDITALRENVAAFAASDDLRRYWGQRARRSG